MKCIFIVNPLAGEGKTQKVIKEKIEAIPHRDECEIYLTKAPNDATEFVRTYCTAHKDEQVRFIACGGDGTINEVFNGAAGFENASVSCYPCGSGNDFVKAFGGAETFTDIDKLVTAEAKKLDLLKIGDRYSVNVTNFGFDTTVAITVNDDRAKNGHGSKSSYTKGVVKALLNAMKTTCTVIADGEVMNPDGNMLLCTVANGQYVGGSFKCAPRAVTDDGLMEVCLVKPISRLRFVKLLTPYTNGEHLDRADMKDIVVYKRAKKVEVIATKGFAYSLDGEIIYGPHFTIEIAEGALNFAVPEYSAEPAYINA
ncbi:MAG: diacylglycerol kinase family lipid kinase [Clostridia bacterium]|nr:diacylglycerol kinase family lipid kinase [Clostridia bacterium]